MPKKKDFCCLMLETRDRRRFFTYEKNYDQLVEFSQVFGGNISVVKVNEADILDIADLVPAICNPVPNKRLKYQVIKTKVKRKTVFQMAEHVRNAIHKEFLSGKTVVLKKVHRKFAHYGLSLSAICNHISKVRKQLTAEGLEVSKLGGGKYCLKQPTATNP